MNSLQLELVATNETGLKLAFQLFFQYDFNCYPQKC